MSGGRAWWPKHPVAGLAALALLVQVLLGVPLSVRMMGQAAICAAGYPAEASWATPVRTAFHAGSPLAASPERKRPLEPGDQHPPHHCLLCFAAGACPVLPPGVAACAAPPVSAEGAPSAWQVATWPPAQLLPYRSRAPPALA